MLRERRDHEPFVRGTQHGMVLTLRPAHGFALFYPSLATKSATALASRAIWSSRALDSAARASASADRHMLVLPRSPTVASPLSVPDVASFAVNHLYRGPEFDYVADFKHKITYVG